MLKTTEFFDYLTDEGFSPEMIEDDEEIAICCPLCDDDRYKLNINSQSGVWHCFHCKEEGGLHRFFLAVMEMGGSEAYTLRQEMESDDYEFDAFEPKQRKSEDYNKTTKLELPQAFQQLEADGTDTKYLRYLQKRGVSATKAAEWGIGYCESGRFAGRIIIPVKNDGHLYTFIARSVRKTCPNCTEVINDCICRPHKFPKVLTPTKKNGADPSLTLMGLDAWRATGSKRCIVVEGVFDALSHPDCVALCGSAASATQILLLAGVSRGAEIILALDNDEAGLLGTYKIASALTSELVDVKIALLPDGKDPNDMTTEEFEDAVKAARRFKL